MEDKIMCIAIRVLEKTVDTIKQRKILSDVDALYEAVHWCWVANIARASGTDYVLAVVNYGNRNYKIEAIFKPKEWHEIGKAECLNKICPKCHLAGQPDRQPCGRIGFTCAPPVAVADAEINKRIKACYPGNIIRMGQNPIAYISL